MWRTGYHLHDSSNVVVIFDARPPRLSIVLQEQLPTFTQDHNMHAPGLPHLILVRRIWECTRAGAALINAVTFPEF